MAIKVETICPNCGSPALREGNKITCEPCDAVYAITKESSARVKQTGRLDDHEQRISALEKKLEPEPEPESEQGEGEGKGEDQDEGGW